VVRVRDATHKNPGTERQGGGVVLHKRGRVLNGHWGGEKLGSCVTGERVAVQNANCLGHISGGEGVQEARPVSTCETVRSV